MNVNEDGRVDLTTLKYVSEAEATREKRLLKEGDVLFNNTNSPELVGKTAYYCDPKPRAFSNHMTRLRCDTRILDARFCAASLHQKWREGHFQAVCNPELLTPDPVQQDTIRSQPQLHWKAQNVRRHRGIS